MLTPTFFRASLVAAAWCFRAANTGAQDAPDAAVPRTTVEERALFETADAELNRVYRQCIQPEAATVQSIAALERAQRLWVEYREANAAAYQTAWSSRQSQQDQYCFYARTVITRSRIRELQTLFPRE